MLRARKQGVPTPVLYLVEHEASAVYMELIRGCSVKAALHEGRLSDEGAARAPAPHACMRPRCACPAKTFACAACGCCCLSRASAERMWLCGVRASAAQHAAGGRAAGGAAA